MFRLKTIQVVVLAILACTVFLVGCTGSYPATNFSAPLAAGQTPCAPRGDDFYRASSGVVGIQNEKAKIYAASIYSLYLQDKNKLGLSRSRAIDFLAYETERWSHVEHIQIDDTNQAWIVMTFISPELIRAALLNHVLFDISQSSTSNSALDDFTNSTLSAFNEQKKYLFMIAIQPETTDQFPMTIEIPSSKIVLINNSGLHVNVNGNESFLDQNFDFASESRAGFFSYPFGKMSGGECNRVLDPSRDTIITLNIEGKFGGTKKTISWEIPFAPPLPVAITIPPSDLADLPDNEKTPLKDLSEVDLSQAPDPGFWRAFGRLVWGKLTFDPLTLH